MSRIMIDHFRHSMQWWMVTKHWIRNKWSKIIRFITYQRYLRTLNLAARITIRHLSTPCRNDEKWKLLRFSKENKVWFLDGSKINEFSHIITQKLSFLVSLITPPVLTKERCGFRGQCLREFEVKKSGYNGFIADFYLRLKSI